MMETNKFSYLKIILKSDGFLKHVNEVLMEWKPSNILKKECPILFFLDIIMPRGWMGGNSLRKEVKSLFAKDVKFAILTIIYTPAEKRKKQKIILRNRLYWETAYQWKVWRIKEEDGSVNRFCHLSLLW